MNAAGDAFTRIEVSLSHPTEAGWFISKGVTADQDVVVVPAQQLLSIELKGKGENDRTNYAHSDFFRISSFGFRIYLMLQRLVHFSLKFRGVVVVLACVLLGYGIYVAKNAKLDVFPNFVQPRSCPDPTNRELFAGLLTS